VTPTALGKPLAEVTTPATCPARNPLPRPAPLGRSAAAEPGLIENAEEQQALIAQLGAWREDLLRDVGAGTAQRGR
jgi:hypothetical protein